MKVQIEDHKLMIDGKEIADLPRLPFAADVLVYTVPVDYRDSGIFHSVRESPDLAAMELPACSEYELIAVLELPPHDDAVLSQAKKEVLSIAIAEADQMLKVLEKDCTEREIKTWDQQAIEAASPSGAADLELTNTIARYRGVGSEDLRSRVNTKSFMYKSASGAIIGAKQFVEDRIEEAESLDDLFAVGTVLERINAVSA